MTPASRLKPLVETRQGLDAEGTKAAVREAQAPNPQTQRLTMNLLNQDEKTQAIALLPCPKCQREVEFEHSYHEDNHRYPRDFWHVRVACQSCGMVDTGWTAYGNQEQKVANCHVRQAAEQNIANSWNTRGTPTPPQAAVEAEREALRKFSLGDRVEKISGASWAGKIVGFYSTSLTPVGYAVESEREPGSVQIYPERAMRTLTEVSR